MHLAGRRTSFILGDGKLIMTDQIFAPWLVLGSAAALVAVYAVLLCADYLFIRRQRRREQ